MSSTRLCAGLSRATAQFSFGAGFYLHIENSVSDVDGNETGFDDAL